MTDSVFYETVIMLTTPYEASGLCWVCIPLPIKGEADLVVAVTADDVAASALVGGDLVID